MKRLVALTLAVLALVSCTGTDDLVPTRCNTIIADYLYGVEYDTYDFNACKKYFDNQFIPAGAGCSEVRRGNFIGRNLDWYINRNASAIIRINHSDDHFASIGIVGCMPEFNNDLARSGEYSEIYQYLPFKTEDGINEKGLYVGINVMPTGETSFDPNNWEPHKAGHGANHTRPGASMTCAVNYLARILLDRAASVADAMAIIDSIDWMEPVNFPHEGETQSFHWLICDPDSSVVLEFMDNQAHYVKATSVSEPGFGTIMTNFTNCLWEKGIMQINGAGYERYDLLKAQYDKYPGTMEGMQQLMEQVWYSKAYTTPCDSSAYWHAEFADDNAPASYLYGNADFYKNPEIRSILESYRQSFLAREGWFTDACSFWFSTHTSVYDISARKLHVKVHEGFNGMESYYEASLTDSHFAKPF